jgi:hypothetical protein
MELPMDEQLVRHENVPAWSYTGQLEPAIALVRERSTTVETSWRGGVFHVSTTEPGRSTSTTADSEEDAWRAHIGDLFGRGKPYPDDARPGEALSAFRERTKG